MIYRLVVRRQAKADIREAARWYERRRAGLGSVFVQQIDAVLDHVRLNPMQYQIVYRDVRPWTGAILMFWMRPSKGTRPDTLSNIWVSVGVRTDQAEV